MKGCLEAPVQARTRGGTHFIAIQAVCSLKMLAKAIRELIGGLFSI